MNITKRGPIKRAEYTSGVHFNISARAVNADPIAEGSLEKRRESLAAISSQRQQL